jgi:hypothetical protein
MYTIVQTEDEYTRSFGIMAKTYNITFDKPAVQLDNNIGLDDYIHTVFEKLLQVNCLRIDLNLNKYSSICLAPWTLII